MRETLETNASEKAGMCSSQETMEHEAAHLGHTNDSHERRRRSRKRSLQAKGGANVRANGRDASSVVPSSAPQAPDKSRAASDDASGATAAVAASRAAAGADRAAYAEVARLWNGEESAGSATREPLPPSDLGELHDDRDSLDVCDLLPMESGAFADEMHARVDLYQVYQKLLNSDDEKVSQRAVEKILEMKYGKGATAIIEEPQIIFDIPRPIRN